ncbi:MAG TPA: hypothetical protein VFS92_08165, partial [Planctomycetota bacterium]|nr:hypothetical protein [Planctomycetota bacterium]
LGRQLTAPREVTVELEVMVRDGGYRAGNMQTVRTVKLRAERVQEWDCELEPGALPYHFSGDGVFLVEDAPGVALDIAAPDEPCSRLVCERLVVVESRDREQRIAPFASGNWVSATVPRGELPSPREWVDIFHARGRDATWRYYAGEARAPEQVPAKEYTGWFLQLRERIPANDYGVFFAWAKTKGEGFELTLELQDDAVGESLWPVARSALAEFPLPTIQSGNCFFTAEEWRRFLADGTIPVPP